MLEKVEYLYSIVEASKVKRKRKSDEEPTEADIQAEKIRQEELAIAKINLATLDRNIEAPQDFTIQAEKPKAVTHPLGFDPAYRASLDSDLVSESANRQS